jgi:hypothetical protein
MSASRFRKIPKHGSQIISLQWQMLIQMLRQDMPLPPALDVELFAIAFVSCLGSRSCMVMFCFALEPATSQGDSTGTSSGWGKSIRNLYVGLSSPSVCWIHYWDLLLIGLQCA